jgi:predicted component of type VI protein secretion system
MAAQFQLVVRSGPNAGKTYPLEADEIIVGRDASNTISINDSEISRKHAKLNLHGAAYVIQDLGSTNGTFINGQRVTGTQVLNPGDSVSFGENIILLYESAFDPNATLISSAKAPKTVTPVSRPAAAPVRAATPAPAGPAPVYSNPVPAVQAAAPVKRKFPVWIIILIILLLVICLCVGFFLVIDQFGLWCQVLPFLVPLLGGTCA